MFLDSLLDAIRGEHGWRGPVIDGECGVSGVRVAGGLVRDDTLSMSEWGRPSPCPFAEARGGP